MSKQEKFVKSQEELEQLRSYQEDLIKRFGSDEHQALRKIFKEIGLNQKAQDLVDNLEWNYSDHLIEANDVESLIPIYCDTRISPTGIIGIKERILELNSRNPVENLILRLESAERLETIIQSNCSISLLTISNEDLAKRNNFPSF